MSDTIHKIHIGLQENSYDILIGSNLFADAFEDIRPIIENRQVIIISDEQVAGLHLEAVETALSPHVRMLHSALVPAGEASKCYR